MHRILPRWLALFVGVIVSLSSIASAQPSQAEARITFTMAGTDPQGPTSELSASALDLRPNERRSTFLFTSLDGRTRGATPDEAAAARYPLYWRLAARLVAVEIDAVTVELNWERVESRGGASKTVDGDGNRTIRIAEGVHHLLDWARCPPGSAMANVVIDVRASQGESDANARIGLRYDLWLVRTLTDGRRAVRKISLNGRQGRRLEYRFESIPLPIDAGSEDSPLRLEVDGTIAAREMPDGTVRMVLETSRRLVFPTGGGGSRGEKTLTTRLGESIEIQLPNATGRSAWKTADALPRNPRPGVTIDKGWVKVDEATFEAGAITTLIVTVNRER